MEFRNVASPRAAPYKHTRVHDDHVRADMRAANIRRPRIAQPHLLWDAHMNRSFEIHIQRRVCVCVYLGHVMFMYIWDYSILYEIFGSSTYIFWGRLYK